MQLLACHGLQRHGEVEGCDGNLRHLLERHDEAFLRDSDIVDSYTGNGEVRVWFGDVIPHCVLGLVDMIGCIPQWSNELIRCVDRLVSLRRRNVKGREIPICVQSQSMILQVSQLSSV